MKSAKAKMICAHCAERPAVVDGLCIFCHSNPKIRNCYSGFREEEKGCCSECGGDGESDGFDATDTLPGSQEREAVYRDRVRRGLPYHHPGDRADFEGAAAGAVQPPEMREKSRVEIGRWGIERDDGDWRFRPRWNGRRLTARDDKRIGMYHTEMEAIRAAEGFWQDWLGLFWMAEKFKGMRLAGSKENKESKRSDVVCKKSGSRKKKLVVARQCPCPCLFCAIMPGGKCCAITDGFGVRFMASAARNLVSGL